MTKMPRGFEDFIRFGGGGAVGAFSHDLDTWVNQLDGFGIDLAFEGSRDEHIHFLGDPGVAIFDDIAGFSGFGLVDRAVLVGDGHQEVRINAICLADGVGGLVFAVPVGNANHLAA